MDMRIIPSDLYNKLDFIVSLVQDDPAWIDLTEEQIERAYTRMESLLKAVPSIRELLYTHRIAYAGRFVVGIELLLLSREHNDNDVALVLCQDIDKPS